MFSEYLLVFKYFIFSMAFVVVLFFLPLMLVYHNFSTEKLSPYECGFNAFGDARSKFEIRFYLIGVLFIIFDLELTFLFPWSVAFPYLGQEGLLSMASFLFLLTLGFAYEWQRGALDWE